MNFWHKLFHPFCQECAMLAHEIGKPCESCETLRQVVADLKEQNKLLLEKLITPSQPEERAPQEELQPIVPRTIPWKVRREMLEQQDREKAEAIRQQKETERLEAELLKKNAR